MASTFYNPRYNRSLILEVVTRTPKEGPSLDCLDQRLLDMTDNITQWAEHTYRQGEVLTTLVFKQYGTTTLTWFIKWFNGLYHESELEPGMLLRFPARGQIDEGLIAKTSAGGIKLVI